MRSKLKAESFLLKGQDIEYCRLKIESQYRPYKPYRNHTQ